MSSIAKRTIYVGPADNANTKPLHREAKATQADILPGMAVESVATGLQKNATAATEFSHLLLIADKDQMRSKSVDDLWAINENMVALQPRSGEVFNVLVADGNNITALDTPITVNGAGKFKIATTPTTIGVTSEQVLAYADEVINISGADALVRVRVA